MAEPKDQKAWFNHIETWEQSGLAQKQYCKTEDDYRALLPQNIVF